MSEQPEVHTDGRTYIVLDLELLSCYDSPFDIVERELKLKNGSAHGKTKFGRDAYLQFLNGFHINDNADIAVLRSPSFFQHSSNLTVFISNHIHHRNHRNSHLPEESSPTSP